MKNLQNVKIVEIVEIDQEEVYDITVPGNHNFILNGNILSSNCFVVADEMQNSTQNQMKMFLTRIGYGTTYVINGDYTQIDLEEPGSSGLRWAASKLMNSDKSIAVMNFQGSDTVRNPIIEKIISSLDEKSSLDYVPRQRNGHQSAAPSAFSPRRDAPVEVERSHLPLGW